MAKPAAVAPIASIEPVYTYGFGRDPATGCWVYSRYELPPDVAEQCLAHIDEPRHLLGAMSLVTREIQRRDGGQ